MNVKLFFVAFVAIAGLSFTIAQTTSYTVSTTESAINWKGYKVTGSHTGTVALKSGALEMEKGVLTGGNFVIDMTTIKVTDLTGGGATKLEGHLKSADFFGTENNPTASLNITKAIPYGTSGKYKIVADLTIKGITQSIKFMAEATEKKGEVTATATITVDRSDFDVKYGSGSFFDGLGDKAIYDEFNLDVTLVAQ